MAEAIVAELVKSISMNVGSSVWETVVSAGSIESQIRGLQDLKNTIEATLFDAESGQACTHSQRDVLEKLERGLAKLIDFQDAKAAKAKQKQLMAGSKFTKEMRTFFSSSNQVVSSFKDARKIKAITGELSLATRNHAQFGSIISSSSSNQKGSLINESGAHINTDLVIGRDGERDKLVSLLLDSSNAAGILSVASIVGIGGVGKTTLAQYVCNDERLRNCFDVKLWVSATQEFNVKDVLRKIVASATGDVPLNYEMDQLQQHLFRAIVGKRFLLVLDSVWDHDSLRTEWLELKSLLRVGAQGSKVLLTTRSDTVARMISTEDPHMVGDLDNDHSWLLFKHVAFTRWHEPGTENIGKEIAKLCPRVPLVIRAIGSLLAGKHTALEWSSFRDDQLTNFASYGRDIMSTLKLSYDHLDERLKLCVLYCSLFPKKYMFGKNDLIRLWTAMGYVEGEFTNQCREDVAEAYVLCLLKRGFFYCFEENIYECPEYFWMHDLMHDLVLSIAGYKYKRADSSTDEFDDRVCHVSYASIPKSSWAAPSSLFKIKKLKSFLLPLSNFGGHPSKVSFFPGHEIFISRVRSLRVLRMFGLGINKLPRSLGELIHLRYLDFSHNAFRKLPESVTQLVNLYLLDLTCCKYLEELPKDINKLVMLRHLMIHGCGNLRYMPKGLGRLTGLETLNYFVVGKPQHSYSLSGSNIDLVCGLADLRHFDNVKGKLNIILVYRSQDIMLEAKSAILHKKEKITHFQMEFRGSTEEDEMVFDNLKPGANLTSLDIYDYAGKQMPCWMRERIYCWLPNLVRVHISNCNGCTYVCSFGRLPLLKNLTLLNMDKVEYIEIGSSSTSSSNNDNAIVLLDEHSSTPLFPSLEYLELRNMPKLKGWWSVTEHAQNEDEGLNQLQKWMPAFPKLEEVKTDMELVKLVPGNSLKSLDVTGNHIERAEPSGILFKNHLPMLYRLKYYENDTKLLPEEFQGMSSLETIVIYNCKYFEAIPDWIDSLTSLSSIFIHKCPRLKSLPSQMSNLSNLELLLIEKCSRELAERCQEPTGEDWPKIKHIRKVSIVPSHDNDS